MLSALSQRAVKALAFFNREVDVVGEIKLMPHHFIECFQKCVMAPVMGGESAGRSQQFNRVMDGFERAIAVHLRLLAQVKVRGLRRREANAGHALQVLADANHLSSRRPGAVDHKDNGLFFRIDQIEAFIGRHMREVFRSHTRIEHEALVFWILQKPVHSFVRAEILGHEQVGVGQRQMRHAAGGDAAAKLHRMNEHDKFDDRIKRFEPSAVTTEIGLQAVKAMAAIPRLLQSSETALFDVAGDVHLKPSLVTNLIIAYFFERFKQSVVLPALSAERGLIFTEISHMTAEFFPMKINMI